MKMLNIDIKSEESLNILKIISGSSLDRDLLNYAKNSPKYLVRLSFLWYENLARSS
jgi:hypothetical protein